MNKKCQIFTPKDYVEELLNSVGYTQNLYGKKILENSCGDGNILTSVVQRYIDDCKANGLSRTRIKNGLEKDVYGIEIDEKQYERCLHNLNEILTQNNIKKVKWKIYNNDYLHWNENVEFQYIVGNPPYITYSELNKNEQLYVKNNFKTCAKGKFDYCYAFIEKSIRSLAADGKMSYLVPSSIFKTVFGYNLRIFMCSYISEIKDYTQVKIFDKALVKSSIMILNKQREQNVLKYRDMTLGTQIEIPIESLEDKWLFSEKSEKRQHRFGDYFKVSHVVATLLNKAYILPDGTYREVENGFICGNHTIEREIVKSTDTPRTLRYNKHEKIIFPYTYNNGRIVHFADGEFERLYPGAAAYLNGFREDLDKRQSDNSAKWYEYGRSQALNDINNSKLLISTVATNDIDVYELDQECIPYAGMYIVEKGDTNKYTLKDAIKILRSDEFKEYVFKVGIPISGRSVRITSKDVENFMFDEVI
ncbi:N-6 DNA methylase [Faecalicoccus acidiformans]|uniref:site-specific DNA-methyltransferase (adenine-specific) n=2 Tax=Faecalicoccus acidiformans TaxID=915173 RepID=A0ABS2FR49_9FIRM|nr:N-6 DNA methylase [Faecalicoccus acidiformans]